LFETNRGGDVTFHGPGQLVGYPIVDLGSIRKDVGWYLRVLEEVLIRTIQELGLPAERRPGMTGVWVGESKVAAIGVHISRWVTSHGFALNVATDLRYFRHIIPCGIYAFPVSSLETLCGAPVDGTGLEQSLANHFGELFGFRMDWSAQQNGERSHTWPLPMC
jgi:lipoyl(octanoyl) transferase